jgi:hypothetical protein
MYFYAPMKKQPYIAYALAVVGVVLCILQVWLPACYPNGDGPCHLANAKAMATMWWGQDASAYTRFYTFSTQPNPNWLNEVVLAVLQVPFGNVMAEKVLLTIYMLGLMAGLARLLRHLNPTAAAWWLPAFTMLVIHNAMAQGFYNFTCSVAFFVWFVASWLSFLQGQGWRNGVGCFLLLGFTYFSHPVSFVFACVAAGALWLSYTASGTLQGRQRVLVPLAVLLVQVLPFVWMFLQFADANGGLAEIKIAFAPRRLQELAAMKYLINYSHKEADVLIAGGVVFALLLLLMIGYRIAVVRGIHRYDGLLLTLVFALVVFLLLPDAMLHGGYFVLRAGTYIYVLVLVCCVWLPLPAMAGRIAGPVLLGVFVVLFAIRMPIVYEAAAEIEDQLSTLPYIKPGSVVLPLNYDTWGKGRDGRRLCSENNIFCHTMQYTSDIPGVVSLDNFEANTGYFPLNWHPDVDPFRHLGRWPGLQASPPAADIAAYKQQTGIQVDYVVTIHLDDYWRTHEHAKALVAEVARDYRVVYRSPRGTTVLWQHN